MMTRKTEKTISWFML